jgi:choline-sulfatase
MHTRLFVWALMGVVAGWTAGPTRLACAAQGAQATWRVPRTVEVHLADSQTGAELPWSRSDIAGAARDILGTTGRVALSRRDTWVGPGGRLFAYVRVPEALAGADREFDIYVRQGGGWRPVDTLRYKAGGKRLVSRNLLLPDLQEGAAEVEVHARGVVVADWQELLSAPVWVPADARLEYGILLDGVNPDNPMAVEVEVMAMADDGTQRTLLARSIKPTASTQQPWLRIESELDGMAGHQVKLRFRSKPVSPDGTPTPGVVWGAPLLRYDQERQSVPVITLVSMDSLRADFLGVYGAKGNPTPFMDSWFGKGGAVFPAAVAASASGVASHMTMMTSLLPCVHGVTDIRSSLGPSVETLAQQMRRAGYRTAAFTEGGVTAAAFGFNRGFDVWDSGRPWNYRGEMGQDSAFARALAWLRDHDGQPVFLFIHSNRSRPDGESVETVEQAERMRSGYKRNVAAADAELAGFLPELERIADAKRSLTVVTSATGMALGEHGIFGHRIGLFDESLRVPLLVRGMGVKAGKVHKDTVGIIDVAPTIMEVAGVHATSQPQGRSVAPILAGKRMSLAPHRFSEAEEGYAVRVAGHKVLMWTPGRDVFWEAYDITRDPRERRNLLASRGAREAWVERLRAAVRNYPNVCSTLERRSGPPPALTNVERRQLSALGYF